MKFSARQFFCLRVRRHIWDRSDEADSNPSRKVDGLGVSLPSLYYASMRGKPCYWYLGMKKGIKPFSTKNTFIRCWALKRKPGRGVVSCTQKAIFVQDIKGSRFGKKARQVSWNQSVDLRNLGFWQKAPCEWLLFWHSRCLEYKLQLGSTRLLKC